MRYYYYALESIDYELKVGVTAVKSGKRFSGLKRNNIRHTNWKATNLHTILLADGKVIVSDWVDKLTAVEHIIKDMALFEDLNTFSNHILKVDGKQLKLSERREIVERFRNSKIRKVDSDFACYVLADDFRTTDKVTA